MTRNCQEKSGFRRVGSWGKKTWSFFQLYEWWHVHLFSENDVQNSTSHACSRWLFRADNIWAASHWKIYRSTLTQETRRRRGKTSPLCSWSFSSISVITWRSFNKYGSDNNSFKFQCNHNLVPFSLKRRTKWWNLSQQASTVIWMIHATCYKSTCYMIVIDRSRTHPIIIWSKGKLTRVD